MGGGSYNVSTRSFRAKSKGYDKVTKDNLDTVFTQIKSRNIHQSLDPNGVNMRESRDSDEHPESLAIMTVLDLTGSMGSVPAKMIRDGIPNMIQRLFDAGVEHPQVAFVGIGDHECDRYPLQVGQFESSDELLDASLEKVYPEGGGGGNGGESYLLAWYHAAFHTSIDCHEKRGQKGILVTIGDEPGLTSVPGSVLAKLYGMQSEKDFTDKELLQLVSQKYHCIHVNISGHYTGKADSTKNYWNNLLGDNVIHVQSHEEIPEVIAREVVARCKRCEVPTQTSNQPTSGFEEISGEEPML